MEIIKITAELIVKDIDKDSFEESLEEFLTKQCDEVTFIEVESTPILHLGDLGIFWDRDKGRKYAVISMLSAFDKDSRFCYQTSASTWYSDYTPFINKEQFEKFLRNE